MAAAPTKPAGASASPSASSPATPAIVTPRGWPRRTSGPRVRSVCVFCGSATGTDPRFMALATDLGAALARAAVRLVYGGGRVGLMGAVAKAAFEGGGAVLGIIPECLTAKEIVFDEAPVEIVPDLHVRKARMAEECDAFIVLPGGVGTLEEAVEILSWARLGLHTKPLIFLDHNGYWDSFFALLQHQVTAGFTPPELMRLVTRAHSAEAALAQLAVNERVGS